MGHPAVTVSLVAHLTIQRNSGIICMSKLIAAFIMFGSATISGIMAYRRASKRNETPAQICIYVIANISYAIAGIGVLLVVLHKLGLYLN